MGNEPTRYLPGYRPLHMSVDKIARPLLGKSGRTQGMIVMYWPEIVGQASAKVMQPTRVSYDRHNRQAILHVDVLAEHATQVEYELPQLLEKLHAFFGYQAVHQCKLHQVTGTL